MNRTIIFRVWDILNNKMMNDSLTLAMTLDGRLSKVDFGGDGEWEGTHFSKDKYIIMQYTNVSDYTSERIFEGDILESFDGIKGIVFFEDGSYKLTSDFDIITNFEVYDLLNEDLVSDNELKIIGNVYENPETLELL